MKILALITARGGSKRLPSKNKRLLGGKPLITWSIEAAKGISEICDILVSTDDPEIAEISKDAGALVPWLRPTELSTDTALSIDVVLHALRWYEAERGNLTGILLLQPTSPFRTSRTIIESIKLFRDNNKNSVISVSHSHIHPMWMFEIENNCLKPIIQDEKREQYNKLAKLTETYNINGSIYLASSTNIIKNRSFLEKNTVPLLIKSTKESLDIDTEEDWELAKLYLTI